ncbi:MAG: hypothetical protein AB7U18_19655 [Dehalococcoidia bacterium]
MTFDINLPHPAPLPPFPDEASVQSQTAAWRRYTDQRNGFEVHYPDGYTVDSHDGVAFRSIGDVTCSISVQASGAAVTPEGLSWVEPIKLGGVSAERRHVVVAGLYPYEQIVVNEPDGTFWLVAGPPGDWRTCELIFATFRRTPR